MMDFVPFDDAAVPLLESELFLVIPEVANNPDFTAEASQAEVVGFFKDRYPVMVKLADGEAHASFTQKKAYPEFFRSRRRRAAADGDAGRGGEDTDAAAAERDQAQGAREDAQLVGMYNKASA